MNFIQKILIILLFGFMCLTYTYGLDSALEEQEDTTDFFKSLIPTDLSFGFKTFYLDYKENIPENPEFKSQERGFLPGLFISTTTNRVNPLYFYINFEYVKGDETYDGGKQSNDTSNTITPYTGTTSSAFWQLDLGFRYRFELSENIYLIPYLGLSLRNWDRNIAANDPSGIEEVYTWQNVPIGIKFEFPASDRISVLLDLYSNLMYNGTINVLFSQRSYTMSDLKLNLNNLTGYGGGISLNYYMNKNITIFLNPYAEYYGFNKSNIFTQQHQNYITFIYEPSSRTYHYGTRLGATFRF
jgi:hypothetical protein